MRYCAFCGSAFNEKAVNQVYCSPECRYRYISTHGHGQPHITLLFDCAYCGRSVVTSDHKDKRTRFCCHECEKKYWRHPPWENTTENINFHSVGEYFAHERRQNRMEGA